MKGSNRVYKVGLNKFVQKYFVLSNSKMASKKPTQEQIIAGFQEMRQQQRQFAGKISDIEMDMKEHEYETFIFLCILLINPCACSNCPYFGYVFFGHLIMHVCQWFYWSLFTCLGSSPSLTEM